MSPKSMNEDARTSTGAYHQSMLGVTLKMRDAARRIEWMLPDAYAMHHELLTRSTGEERQMIADRDETIKMLEGVISQLRDEKNHQIYNLQASVAPSPPRPPCPAARRLAHTLPSAARTERARSRGRPTAAAPPALAHGED